ncbi:MAG: GntR family transcriptional regulator [Acidimicrobiales bacterium]
MIEFRIESSSGAPPYRQIVHQVRQALTLGVLVQGDQLPTVKEVVGQVTINPNTVLKAYRELEMEGLAEGRPGVGTFITRSLVGSSLAAHHKLQVDLRRWLHKARSAGLDDASIQALFESTFRSASNEEIA